MLCALTLGWKDVRGHELAFYVSRINQAAVATATAGAGGKVFPVVISNGVKAASKDGMNIELYKYPDRDSRLLVQPHAHGIVRFDLHA